MTEQGRIEGFIQGGKVPEPVFSGAFSPFSPLKKNPANDIIQ